MENNKNELGNIYGSRISKNGKWLNLLIVTRHGNETIYITCPVRMEYSTEKPYATPMDDMKAIISNVPIYQDRKEEPKDETPTSDELPF